MAYMTRCLPSILSLLDPLHTFHPFRRLDAEHPIFISVLFCIPLFLVS